MAMVRNSRCLLARLAVAASRNASSPRELSSSSSWKQGLSARYFQSRTSHPLGATWGSLLPSTPLVPDLFNIQCRSYAKRPKKWQGGPHAFIQVEPGKPVPPSQPNAGSVKNRKRKKRMAQKDAFIKAQAHKRKVQTKAALIARDAARRKRWREGAARARAWALQQAKAVTGNSVEPVSV